MKRQFGKTLQHIAALPRHTLSFGDLVRGPPRREAIALPTHGPDGGSGLRVGSLLVGRFLF